MIYSAIRGILALAAAIALLLLCPVLIFLIFAI